MTRQRKNRVISMLLVAVMVLGMVPVITRAAEEPKVESSMKLEHAFDFSLISALCHSDELGVFQNYYTSPVTRGGLGKNPWNGLCFPMQWNLDKILIWSFGDCQIRTRTMSEILFNFHLTLKVMLQRNFGRRSTDRVSERI